MWNSNEPVDCAQTVGDKLWSMSAGQDYDVMFKVGQDYDIMFKVGRVEKHISEISFGIGAESDSQVK